MYDKFYKGSIINCEKRLADLKNTPFSHKTVLITGAGSGLGRALALHFAEKSWKLVVADSNLVTAQETQDMIQSKGGKAFAAEVDVRDKQQLEQLRKKVKEQYGTIDVLINNAGVSGGGEFDSLERETLDWLFDINFFGVVNGYQAFASELKQLDRAQVINIASFAAIANPPASGAYNASKAAVVSFSETIRGELAHTNVGVTVVCPSFFRTNLLKYFRSNEDKVKKVADRLMEKSSLNAQQVAAIIYDKAMANQFMVIPHKESQWHYRIKRWFPEFFFKKIKKMTRYLVAK